MHTDSDMYVFGKYKKTDCQNKQSVGVDIKRYIYGTQYSLIDT